jgi:vacuolar protein 8
VSLLRVPDLKVQEQAAATLRNLSATPENRPALVQAGTLPLLIELLSSPEEKIQEQAGVALRNLSDQVDH